MFMITFGFVPLPVQGLLDYYCVLEFRRENSATGLQSTFSVHYNFTVHVAGSSLTGQTVRHLEGCSSPN